jgi:hypothetical protein
MYADDGTIHISRHSFAQGNTGDGWNDEHGNVSLVNGMCNGENIVDRIERDGTDGVRIATRTTRVEPFAPTAGECSDAATATAAAGVPCSNIEVVIGSLVER